MTYSHWVPRKFVRDDGRVCVEAPRNTLVLRSWTSANIEPGGDVPTEHDDNEWYRAVTACGQMTFESHKTEPGAVVTCLKCAAVSR